MIIIQVMGGLGNQMQQYALYEKFKSMGKDVKLDISWFEEEQQQGVLAKRRLELRQFPNVDMNSATTEEIQRLYGNNGIVGKVQRKFLNNTLSIYKESQMFHPEVLELKDGYLIGYWACEAYYHDIMDVLQERFQFITSKDQRNIDCANEMNQNTSVSVHIRRGDYLDAANAAMFGNICTDSYYDSAITYMKEKYPDAHFYIFSDDSEYVKEKYHSSEYSVVDWNAGENSYYDIWLMSQCKHNICANSTFSFWGARLNQNTDKVVIRPTKHKNTQDFDENIMKNLWKDWMFVDPDGKVYM